LGRHRKRLNHVFPQALETKKCIGVGRKAIRGGNNVGLSVSIDGGGKAFEPVTEMLQGAVIADVVDKGMVPNKFKPGTEQHKCFIVWLLSEEDEEGRNKRAFQSFTVSLNEKATLRKFLATLGYKEFDPKQPFDLDTIIGTKRFLVMAEEDGQDGKKYIKITATMPLKKGQNAPDIPSDFVRKADKQN
jgi:hypothetical protein